MLYVPVRTIHVHTLGTTTGGFLGAARLTDHRGGGMSPPKTPINRGELGGNMLHHRHRCQPNEAARNSIGRFLYWSNGTGLIYAILHLPPVSSAHAS
jgi:hypothetical protein